MKRQIIRLTESDLRNIIKNSVKRIIREAGNDDIENGVRASEEDNGDLPYYGAIDTDDADDDDYLGYLNDEHNDEDADIRDYLDDMEADNWINQDDGNMSDDDLYDGRA